MWKMLAWRHDDWSWVWNEHGDNKEHAVFASRFYNKFNMLWYSESGQIDRKSGSANKRRALDPFGLRLYIYNHYNPHQKQDCRASASSFRWDA